MAEIIWSDPALDEFDAIAAHIALDKPVAAARFVARVLTRVEQLARFPLAGGKPRELAGTRYRQLVVPPVRVFYRVEGEHVFIVHVTRSERLIRRSDF
ncbi:MAG: type II toxin-antitoxin system RelE/ParE family toxin [Opitutae bacterium]|nr:type II toxin-antitoxin system RelE/ParE family toxin [Opitutae bacterium]